jgi:hypothetical protein
MPRRTPEEIAAEITALKALYEALPLARNNLLTVMETLQDGLTVDDVYDKYDTEDNEFSYALDAAMWADGESSDRPSVGWD